MPPQQTTIPPEPAGRGFDISFSSARTMADAAAGETSLVAFNDASSEKQAAGPPAVAPHDGRSLLLQCWKAFLAWRARRSSAASLHDLNDRQLMDIGLTRGEIDSIDARRAVDRLRDSILYRALL